MASIQVFHDVLVVVHDVLLVVHDVLRISQSFTIVYWCLTMFSESRNDRHHRIGNCEAADCPMYCDNATGIGNNATEIGDNSTEISENKAGIGDIATKVIPC